MLESIKHKGLICLHDQDRFEEAKGGSDPSNATFASPDVVAEFTGIWKTVNEIISCDYSSDTFQLSNFYGHYNHSV